MQAAWSDVSAVVEGVEVFGVDDEVGGLSFSDEAVAGETRTWPVRQLPSNSVAGRSSSRPSGSSIAMAMSEGFDSPSGHHTLTLDDVSTDGVSRHRGYWTESVMTLRAGLALSGISIPALWGSYLGVGGTMSLDHLLDTLRGTQEVSDHEHDMVAQALNDHLLDQGLNHPVAYAHELPLSP
jgi:hypothetical protein